MDKDLWGISITKENLHKFVDVDEETSCWNWKFGTFGSGYGEKTHKGKQIGVHIIAYKLFNGDYDGEGLCVLHTCDNRICMNPDHLMLGTKGDNIRDCVAKERHRNLSSEIVEEIRRKYHDLGLSQDSLAVSYMVGQATISRIINYEACYGESG